MVTRLFFPGTEASAVSPAFDAGWERSSQAVSRRLEKTKGSDAIAAGSTIDLLEDVVDDSLDRQYVSDPMNAGVVFTSAVTTVQMQLMVRELAPTDNVNRGILGVRIVSEDGATVRATLLAVANYGPTLEFTNNVTMRNKTFADGDTVTATYTTVAGDRIVVEIGYQSSVANTTPQAAAKYGQNAADLPVDETQVTDGAGWVEFSNTVTFQATVVTFNKTSDARTLVTQDLTKTSNARLKVTRDMTKSAAAQISLGATVQEFTKTADARLQVTQDLTKSAAAQIFGFYGANATKWMTQRKIAKNPRGLGFYYAVVDTGNTGMWLFKSTDAETWTPVSQLLSTSGQVASVLPIDTGTQFEMLVVYGRDGPTGGIFYRRLQVGDGVSDPTIGAASTVNVLGRRPTIIRDRNGRVHVLYVDGAGTTSRVRVRGSSETTLTDAPTWSAEQILCTWVGSDLLTAYVQWTEAVTFSSGDLAGAIGAGRRENPAFSFIFEFRAIDIVDFDGTTYTLGTETVLDTVTEGSVRTNDSVAFMSIVADGANFVHWLRNWRESGGVAVLDMTSRKSTTAGTVEAFDAFVTVDANTDFNTLSLTINSTNDGLIAFYNRSNDTTLVRSTTSPAFGINWSGVSTTAGNAHNYYTTERKPSSSTLDTVVHGLYTESAAPNLVKFFTIAEPSFMQSFTKTSNGQIAAGVATQSFTKNADGRVLRTVDLQKSSAADVKSLALEFSKNATADIKALALEFTKGSTADIRGTVELQKTAGADVKVLALEITKASSADIKALALEFSKASAARVLVTQDLQKTSNARLAGTVDMVKSAAARLLGTMDLQKTSNARIIIRQEILKTSDARLRVTQDLLKTSDAQIASLGTVSFVKSAAGDIRVLGLEFTKQGAADLRVLALEFTKAANARLLVTQDLLKSSNARVRSTVDMTKSSTARIQALALEFTKASNARLRVSQDIQKAADARIQTLALEFIKASNARVLVTQDLQKSASARIQSLSLEFTKASNARTQVTQDLQKASDARVLATTEFTKTSGASISIGVVTESFTKGSDARVQGTLNILKTSDARIAGGGDPAPPDDGWELLILTT